MVNKTKTNMKNKAIINDRTMVGFDELDDVDIFFKDRKRRNKKILLMTTFFSGVLLIISSYAWLSASLNVKVKFFDLTVSTDNGLFISLDGVDYSDTVEISIDSLINDLKSTYPNHTNQWASGGLWPVSSNGIKNASRDKFDVYSGEMCKYKDKRKPKKYLNTTLVTEESASAYNAYIAFDVFLKNVSGSPKSDNLFLEDTSIEFEDNQDEEITNSMTNIMNSMRFGFVRIGSTSSKSDIKTIQNLKCNSNCSVVIYEPNSTLHSTTSIEKASEYGISLSDGVYTPTYGVISEGEFLEHTNGHPGTGFPLDIDHFALQRTITNFSKSIFDVPNGVTKLRAYVWIEGQDIDSLETNSKGAAISIAINFVKDLAGYE